MRTLQIFVAAIGTTLSLSSHSLDAREIFKKIEPSIYVVVSKEASGQAKAQGSGVLVGSNLVVTNCHVLVGADSYSLIHKGEQFEAEIRSKDVERDLCLLSSKKPLAAPIVKLSSSSLLENGQAVYAIGAPLGLELTISDGIVSSLRKATGGFIIQTTTPISPGSSGGGLFNNQGQLVGITTFQYAKGQNLNFALPVEWIQQIAARESVEAKLKTLRASYKQDIFALGTMEDNRQNDELAIQRSKAHLAIDSTHVFAQFNLARSLSYYKDSSKAVLEYNKLLSLPISTIDDLFFVGLGALSLSMLYEKNGDIDLARAAAAKASTHTPDEATLGNYWRYLKTEDQYREAIPTYKIAVNLASNSPYAWAYLGGSKMNAGEEAEARIAFKKSIDLKPDYEWPWIGYMSILLKSKNETEAKQAILWLSENQPAILEKLLNIFGKK